MTGQWQEPTVAMVSGWIVSHPVELAGMDVNSAEGVRFFRYDGINNLFIVTDAGMERINAIRIEQKMLEEWRERRKNAVLIQGWTL